MEIDKENLFSSSSSEDDAEKIRVSPIIKHAYSHRFFNKKSMSKHLKNPIIENEDETLMSERPNRIVTEVPASSE